MTDPFPTQQVSQLSPSGVAPWLVLYRSDRWDNILNLIKTYIIDYIKGRVEKVEGFA